LLTVTLHYSEFYCCDPSTLHAILRVSLITIPGSAAEGRIWRKQPPSRIVAVNILRKQTRTVNKGQRSNPGIEPGLPAPCLKS